MNKNKILILDDESAIKENLVLFLEDNDFSVCSINSPSEGIELMKNGEKFDFGIIDIRLPEMSGDKFIIEVHKINPEMKFLIHTGSIDFELSDELINIGLTSKDIFKKPVVDIMSLIDHIKSLL